jgi:glycosyltransferase involved in cell wall biosynthesis
MSAILSELKDGVALPHSLAGFRDLHAGETLVVCGCGSSLRELAHPERHTTIGVNDVGRLFTPDYLLVVNTRSQFAPGRFEAVAQSRARVLFSHLELGVQHPHQVRFALGQRGGVDFSNPDALNYTRNSPYPALCLAIHMGAKRIGLIGVDFTADHFFGATGIHGLSRELNQIDAEYRRLQEACVRAGIEIVNLSVGSRLTAFPKMSLEEFEAAQATPLRVVSYATTPVAGVPAILGRAISHATVNEGRSVWASNGYGNGVVFDGDIEYQRHPAQAIELLEAADVVVVHNGKADPRHAALLRSKPVITMAHNYMWNVDRQFVDAGYPGLVVGQYQATLPEFAGWEPVPNPIELWDAAHLPLADGARNGPVTICYIPSGKHESYPPGHRLYWHAKGYQTTMTALDALARSHGVRLEVARGRQVSHREAMAMKQRAHIVIDECVTGSYHRTSLEGLAVGAVVVNGIGRLDGVAQALQLCAGGAASMPFVAAGPDTLHEVLQGLVERGAAELIRAGQRNRLWMEQHWRFEDQWQQFWMPAVDRAIAAHARQGKSARLHSATSATSAPAPAVALLAATPAAPAASTASAAPEPSAASEASTAPAALAALAAPAVAGVARPPVAGVTGEARPPVAGVAPLPVAGVAPLAVAVAPGADTVGVTAIIPFAGAARLPALRAVLASLQQQQLARIIVVECDAQACAREAAGAAAALHVFLPSPDGFHKARALNAGAALATTEFILWWDADLLAAPGFVAEALAELGQRRLDYLIPWTSVRYLNQHQSQAAMQDGDERTAPGVTSVYSRHGERGAAGLLRRAFIARHGGLAEGFAGTGGECAAFYHKATLFARAAVTNRTDQHLLHLFHPQARALSAPALVAALPYHADNQALLRRIQAIGSRTRFMREFPHPACAPAHAPTITITEPGAMQPDLKIVSTDSAPPAAAPLRVNLGCGDAAVAGFLNVDRFPGPRVDQQVDLTEAWPWADGSVGEVRAWDVIEHLPDKLHTMNEMWRVLHHGGRAEIVVPTTDGPGAFQDPTHVSFWHRRSFLYYEAGNPYRERFAESYGIKAAFRVVRERIEATMDGPKLTIVLEAVKPVQANRPPIATGTPYDVVILSANAGNLVACIDALRTHQPELPPSQIIVVDDGARALAEPLLPGVRWISGSKPFNFSRNANLGIAASTRDVILLNDDARLVTACGFEVLARAAHDGAGRLGALAAVVQGLVGNPRQKPRPGANLRDEPTQLCFICVYLPRATIAAVGELDTRFDGYGYEDNDYCDRIRSAGLGLAVHDGCVVQHGGALPSTFRTRADFGVLAARNRQLYADKRAGAIKLVPARAEVLTVMRIKNEAAHIGEVLERALPFSGKVLVFDDHSEDDTASICASFGARVEVMRSTFSGLDEARDKNALLRQIAGQTPDWVFWIDGDEVLERSGPERLRALIEGAAPATSYALQIAYLWDDPAQLRVDGIYGNFMRPSLFRFRGQATHRLLFPSMGPGNLHCGNVPRGLAGPTLRTSVRLKHYGYLDAEQRQRKYAWYNQIDPGNRSEDEYRHLIGVPGARHAPGPAVLVPWDE